MAVQFQFRFDAVLRHRRHREDAAMLGVAETERRLRVLRVRRAELADETLACRGALADGAERGGSGALLAALAGSLEALHARSARSAAEIAEQQARVGEARAALVEATRARRVLDRLLESARAAHARRVEALEQRQADDLASSGLLWRAAQTSDRVGGAR
jgi:flagellar export protein FliJ